MYRNENWVCKNKQQVADFFEVGMPQVGRWTKDGMPGAQGDYYLPEIFKWLFPKNERGQLRTAYADLRGGKKKREADIRLREAEASLKEIDLFNKQRSLFAKDQVHEVLGVWAAAFRQLGETLEKQWGREALLAFDAALDTAEAGAQKLFDDYDIRIAAREHAERLESLLDGQPEGAGDPGGEEGEEAADADAD